MATMTTRFTVSRNVCSNTGNDSSIIFNVENGLLYSVMGIGSLIFTKLSACPEGLSLNDLVSSVQADFKDQPKQQVRLDADRLLNQLRQKGIIVRTSDESNWISRVAQVWMEAIVQFVTRTLINIMVGLRLIAAAAFLELALVDLMLRIGRFCTLRRIVKDWQPARKKVNLETAEQVCKAVDRAATYYLKNALCLQRSIVTTCLLRSQGVPAQMVIACRRIPFKAHAWVEVDGQVVNDNPK